VIAFFGNADLILVRAKFHMETVFSVREIFEELHKMGHRDWRAVLAMFHKEEDLPKNRPAWFTKHFGKKSKKTFVELIATPPPKTVVDWLLTSKYGAANPVTVQLQESNARRVTYVIMVYGKKPAAVTNVPGDVLLLYAPDPENAEWIINSGTNTDLTKTNSTDREFAAHQLWGYYPISLNPRLPSPRCDPLAAPRDDMAK
jgi:hypothetical protein